MDDKFNDIKENWDRYPKSKNDNEEFVIIAENDMSGSYEEYKECLGVNKNGEIIWSFLSGCSCQGKNENEKDNITNKTFKIEKTESIESFYKTYKCEPYEANYKSY